MSIAKPEAVEIREDRADLQKAQLLQSILPSPRSLKGATELPLLSHWCQFHQTSGLAETGSDGHPKVGSFLPDTGLPRRMWAGSRIDFLAPIHAGASLKKMSSVKAVTPKEGGSGKLCFVTVSHDISADGEAVIREEQDLVYRAEPGDKAAHPPRRVDPPQGAQFEDVISPDPVMLFRFSALTFNSHRIHYDREYAMQVERHEGLVVHGPLIATLLVDLLGRNTGWNRLRHFAFRAVSPLYDIRPFEISAKVDGGRATLWAHTRAGGLAMKAEAEFA